MNVLLQKSMDRTLVGALVTCVMVSLVVASLGLSLGTQVIARWLSEDGTAHRRSLAFRR